MFLSFSLKRVIFCDISKTDIFGSIHQDVHNFDIIIASLVFDVVAVDRSMFKDALNHVLQYLKPGGGLILIQGSLGEYQYSVGSAIFPAMNADEPMIKSIFQECQLELLQWELCVKLTTHYYALLRKP